MKKLGVQELNQYGNNLLQAQQKPRFLTQANNLRCDVFKEALKS